MKIVSNPYQMGSFCATQREPNKDKNPISKGGEREMLFKATVLAGLGFGAKLLLYAYQEGIAVENLVEYGAKLAKKNKKANPWVQLGAGSAVLVGFIGLMAALYTILKTPEIMYKGKINAFVKGKDMSVYSKSNDIEKDLYDQMNEKAKGATAEEKEVLKQQYLKLKAAKNPTPEFITGK